MFTERLGSNTYVNRTATCTGITGKGLGTHQWNLCQTITKDGLESCDFGLITIGCPQTKRQDHVDLISTDLSFGQGSSHRVGDTTASGVGLGVTDLAVDCL